MNPNLLFLLMLIAGVGLTACFLDVETNSNLLTVNTASESTQTYYSSNSNEECDCDDVYEPVCGMDQTTYSNRCQAACQNVNVAYEGECEENCPDIAHPEPGFCAENEFVIPIYEGDCAVDWGCSLIQSGFCQCSEIYAPICGNDGITYSNACIADCKNVAIAAEHSCAGDVCEDALSCEEGFHCEPVKDGDEPWGCISNDDYLIEYVISGSWGFRYVHRIYRNGYVYLEATNTIDNTLTFEWKQAPRSLVIENFQNSINIGFFEFPDNYYGEINCCDQAFYFIKIHYKETTHDTEWHDFADPSAEALQVQEWIEAIIDSAT